jgi:hypothetical protein
MTPAHCTFNLNVSAHDISSLIQQVGSLLRTACAMRNKRSTFAQGLPRLLARRFPPGAPLGIMPLARTDPDFGVRAGNTFAVPSTQ